MGSPAHEARSRVSIPGSELGIETRDASADAADPAPGGDVYVSAVSTDAQRAEAAAFAAAWFDTETPGQRSYARKHGAVFGIMQYRKIPSGDHAGTTALTQEMLDAGAQWFADNGFTEAKIADVWHGLDRWTDAEAAEAERRGRDVPPVGELKPLHAHVALWLPGGDVSVRQVARAFGVPASRVRPGRDYVSARGADPYKGRTAAADTFFDLCSYLTHEDPRSVDEGKHRYPDEAVRANFDFREELDANRAGLAARRTGGRSGGGLRPRVRALRRAVIDGSMTLDQARDADVDAYAEDLPRLEKLRADYEAREAKVEAARVGTAWRKSLVVITGGTRNGKDLLASALGAELARVAALAGHTWRYVKPAGKNSLEGVGRAELVHHEDMRYRLLPDYDEALRYFDPNQAADASGRFRNRMPPTPRVTMATSSETLLSLGYTLKRRMDTDELVAQAAAADAKGRRPALDIDEFLYRIGWHVDVVKPADAGDDRDRVAVGMTCAISRVVESPDPHRVVPVSDRAGNRVGDIRTQHKLEPVAVIKGAGNAARFLAASIIAERSPDVVAAMPDPAWAGVTTARDVIESDARAVADARVALLEYNVRHNVRLSPPGEPWGYVSAPGWAEQIWGPTALPPLPETPWEPAPDGTPLPPVPVPHSDPHGDLVRGVVNHRTGQPGR